MTETNETPTLTKAAWKGRRVLVTGAAGFIGGNLVKRLITLGATVTGVDLFPPVAYPDWKLLRCDVRDPTELARTFGVVLPEVVFHLAAKTEVLHSYLNPHSTYSTNVTGTLNVLENCRKGRVKTVVVASTDKVYGDYQKNDYVDRVGIGIPSSEVEYLTNPCPDPYSSSKRLADLMAQDYARTYSMPLSILRACNTYGPGQRNETTLITSAVLRILRGEVPVVHSGCEAMVREWMYVDDLVDAYLLTAGEILSPKAGVEMTGEEVSKCLWAHPRVYNVGTGVQLSVAEVVAKIASLMRIDMEGDLLSSSEGHGRASALQVPVQRISAERFMGSFPGWRPKCVPFDDGLARTVEWYRETYARAASCEVGG